MKDAVAFMIWERLVPWKVLSLKEYPHKPIVPIGFGTNSEDFYNLLESGSQIWVVTRIANKHSLAARITVQEMIDRDLITQDKWPLQAVGLLKQWKFVATSDQDDSEFFETNYASSVLQGNGIRFARSKTVVYREESLAGKFQKCMEQGRRTVFISYRWRDAKRFAKGLARELRKAGFSPWLDALALPKYEADRESNKDAPRLNRLIKSGIERSKYAIIINTKTYGESYWTKVERDFLDEKGVPKFLFDVTEAQELNSKQKFYVKLPRDVVQKFLNWVPHNPN